MFFDFYADKFKPFHGILLINRSHGVLYLDIDDNSRLEVPFTVYNIHLAIWDYSSDHAPGPGGFSF